MPSQLANMKTKRLLIFASLIFVVCSASQCKKKTEEPQLPPITTTGAMTFGCKINGKVFVPQDGRGKPGLFCQYVNLGNGEGGGWYLNIPAIDWKPNPTEGVSITTDSLLLQEGTTYRFENSKGTAQAFYAKSIEYTKIDNDSGELTILKFDQTNRILAGTFFFTGTNASTGQTVEVTDGRFDIRY